MIQSVYGEASRLRASYVSRPAELSRQPLAEPDVNLSAHPAPIIQLLTLSQAANAQRDRACAYNTRPKEYRALC
jgi:hypothetical protein